MELLPATNLMVIDDGTDKMNPINNKEKELLEYLVKFLEKLEKATTILSAEDKPTIINACYIYHGLYNHFKGCENDQSAPQIIRNLGIQMKSKFSEVN